MGAPNLQQQLYLKTALNESKDGMFDHPADLDEGYHKKALRLIRAGDWERAAEQGDRDEASALMRGGASERTMKAHFNNQDYAAGRKAMDKFEKAAAKKRKAALKAKGIADLEEGYQRKRMSVIRKAISSTGSGDRSQMKPEVADFLARSFKKKTRRNKVLSGGKGEVAALMVRARKKTTAMKAKGLAEQSITEGLLSKLERLDEANFNTHRPLGSSMSSPNYADRVFAAITARQEGLKKAAEARAARLAAEKAAKKAKK
jgi:hypothetical protein